MAFLFRATRYIGRYLKSLTEIQAFRYFSSSAVPQTRLLGSNIDIPTAVPNLSDSQPAELDDAITLPVFDLPKSCKVKVVQLPDYIDNALKSLVDLLDEDPDASLHLSMDAEWNVLRRTGVSILQLCPHTDPTTVYIVKVHQLTELPLSLLRLLTSKRVWKIGSQIKGDLTRLRKQFPSQLDDSVTFSTIDLKEYAISKGIIQRKQTATLAALCEIVLGMHLPKDTQTRTNNNWEFKTISSRLLHYAACDVVASRQIFERMLKLKEGAPSKQIPEGVIRVVQVAGSSVELSI
ncbi:hypothetical protein GYMLUDRAFT_909987 [Collybiopsis luxurians FD-317 M1]|nr:hypothetical protein GYMLUDRAFT_909987 [Collybiopsis luxurians FD-317 M1]